MENASKALIMAGSVLIALMIIGALLLMFNNLSNYQNTGTQSTKETQIMEFNSQYETYNRNSVRGTELITLLYQAIDYNRRESTAGTGSNQGQYLAYEPITITFNLSNKKEDFSPDNHPRLITSNVYTQSNIENTFKEKIQNPVDVLEGTYGRDVLTNLTTSLTKIFIEDSGATVTEKKDAVDTFNKISTRVKATGWDDIKGTSTIRKDVYTYYEYVQFKRGRFDCEGIEYDPETGRVVKMTFHFTGKFQ